MRKRLSLLLVLALSAVMAYGVIGSSALFSTTSPVYGHDLTSGTLTLEVNGASQAVYCTVAMDTSTGAYECPDLLVKTGGAIVASQVSVTFEVSGDIESNVRLAAQFGDQADYGAVAKWNGKTLVVTNQVLINGTKAGIPFTAAYDWNDLSVQGATGYVRLTFTAQG